MGFQSLSLHRDLLAAIKELGFTRPTPIQEQAIPPALEGRDVLACAMTGSGKTAAFVLPILAKLIDRPRGATRALVLTPTRELAAQVAASFEELAVHTGITGAAIFGGVAMGPQEHALRSGVDVLVATPGRLLDHLGKSYARLDQIEHLVLDEADRMLDMGFLPDVRRILSRIPAKRQTLFFSATMPPPIAALAKEMLRNPVAINLQRQSQPAVGITQAVYPVPQLLKAYLLVELLRRGDMEEVLVFTRTKHRANRLALHLDKAGVSADRIHGNRSQSQRTQALAQFKAGRTRVLVATDIAARGIDVEALGHVVNFDVPKAPEDYVHRIGRTGRAELTGDAFTFVAPDEEQDLRDIERVIGKRLPCVLLPDFDYQQKPQGQLEIPLKERLAAMRAEKRTASTRSGAGGGGGGGRQGAGRARGGTAAQPARRSTRPAEAPAAARKQRPAHARPSSPGPTRPPSRHERSERTDRHAAAPSRQRAAAAPARGSAPSPPSRHARPEPPARRRDTSHLDAPRSGMDPDLRRPQPPLPRRRDADPARHRDAASTHRGPERGLRPEDERRKGHAGPEPKAPPRAGGAASSRPAGSSSPSSSGRPRRRRR